MLGGVEPLLVSKVGHTLLPGLLEAQIRHQPSSSVLGGLRKRDSGSKQYCVL